MSFVSVFFVLVLHSEFTSSIMSMASSNSYLSIYSPLLLLLLLLLLLSVSPTPAESHPIDPSSSVYEILSEFGLPVGLLPDCVTNYSFNPIDGSFVVELEKPSYVQFDYLVYYDSLISGSLNQGSLTRLSGVHVKAFFLWFLVNEIKVDWPRHSIFILVGFVSIELNIHQFDTIHSCDSAVSDIPFLRPIPVEDEMAMIVME